jgi:hypothetical protein
MERRPKWGRSRQQSELLIQSAPFHAKGRFSSKALLRQPGGFEGVGVMAEDLHLSSLSISDRPQLKEVGFDREAALPPAASLIDGSKDCPSGGSHLPVAETPHRFR